MSRKPRLVAVCGSLATESATRIALRELQYAAQDVGAQTTLIDLREYDLPPFDADAQNAGDAPELRTTLQTADSIALGSPMYHGSYSSPLKAALDYSGFDEFEDTTVGLIAVSGGSFPRRALDHVRSVVLALDAWPLPLEVAIPNSNEQVVDGTIVEQSIQDRLERLGMALVRYAGVAGYPAAESSTKEPSIAH